MIHSFFFSPLPYWGTVLKVAFSQSEIDDSLPSHRMGELFSES